MLMQTRPDFREKPGGDVVQLEELLPYLREAGVTVELTGEVQPDLSQWDLVHTINLDRPEDPYRHCLHAVEQGVPVVVSPVHTDMSEFVAWGNPEYWELPDPQVGLPRPGTRAGAEPRAIAGAGLTAPAAPGDHRLVHSLPAELADRCRLLAAHFRHGPGSHGSGASRDPAHVRGGTDRSRSWSSTDCATSWCARHGWKRARTSSRRSRRCAARGFRW